MCDIYKDQKHRWNFACEIRKDNVEEHSLTDAFNINNQQIGKKSVLVKRSDYYKLLFYCKCGKLKMISVSGGTIINVNEQQTDYDGKIPQ